MEPLDTAPLADDTLVRAALAGPDHVVVQPIVDLERHVVAYEALSRYVPAAPDLVLGAAEGAGVRTVAELAALRACLAVRNRVAVPLAVNVAASTLLDPRAQQLLIDAAAGIWVEITEVEQISYAHPDYEQLICVLGLLRSAGATIAVDDAGTATADLVHVLSVRPDIVKLDRHLVNAALRGADGARWHVAELLQASQSIGATIVAEGLDDPALATGLFAGVTLVQSFGCGRPRPI